MAVGFAVGLAVRWVWQLGWQSSSSSRQPCKPMTKPFGPLAPTPGGPRTHGGLILNADAPPPPPPMPPPQVFLTTKVPCCPGVFPIHYCDEAEFNGTTAHDVTIDTAILGTVDLLLLHWPCATIEQTVAAYTELEAALAAGAW